MAMPQAKNDPPRYTIISSKPISNETALSGLSKFIDTKSNRLFQPREDIIVHIQTMQNALSLDTQLFNINKNKKRRTETVENDQKDDDQSSHHDFPSQNKGKKKEKKIKAKEKSIFF
mmetsp:Transcript_6167/g.7890  ORF Transcript_6167/g.7890 Transcript_6167/m.7890 type:complete len:117 (+) Transcript_6167:2-352(+)